MKLMVFDDDCTCNVLLDNICDSVSRFILKRKTFYYLGVGYEVIDIVGDEIILDKLKKNQKESIN